MDLLAAIAFLAILGLIAFAAGVESRDAFTSLDRSEHHS
jgi:hypothetical protein